MKLVGEDGNAFAILGRVITAMQREDVDPDEIAQFRQEATANDYDTLLCVVMDWVKVD